MIYFSRTEKIVIGLVGTAAVLLVHIMIAVPAIVLTIVIVLAHRSNDNHRYDHLDLWIRKYRRPPGWNLCERDAGYERFRPL